MTKPKLALYGLLALIIVFLVGWLMGSSGRRAAESRVQAFELRLGLAEAKAALSGARVDLFELNFGEAVRRLDDARKALELVDARARDGGADTMAGPVREAIAGASAARELAGRMDQAAGSRAADALRALDRAASVLPAN